MRVEWVALFGVAVTLAGFIWHAAVMHERLRRLTCDFEKFEKKVEGELRSMRELLASGVGGRRRYRVAAGANDAGRPSA